MEPPFHPTGSPDLDWIIFGVGALICLYWLRALRLAREGARRFVWNLLIALVLFGVVMLGFSASSLHQHIQPKQEQIVSGFLALAMFGQLQRRKRSRYIPTATKRAIIERDLKGQIYDSSKHHIDHVWPFSRGGSNTQDNLRVIEKRKNLQKGAKRPRMRDMW